MAKTGITADPPAKHDPLGGCLVNLLWLIACPGALVTTAMGIGAGGRSGLRWLDVLYWVVVLVALVARLVDVRVGRSRVSKGEGEAPGAWRGYAMRLMAVAAALWLAAHGTAYVVGR